jgi:hypothetical protein
MLWGCSSLGLEIDNPSMPGDLADGYLQDDLASASEHDLASASDLSVRLGADLSSPPKDGSTADGLLDGGAGDASGPAMLFASTRSFSAGSKPWGVVVGDFNKDNALDVAVTDYGGTSVRVLLGDGMGSFGVPKDTTVGPQPTGIASADFNSDGVLDLVVGSGVPSQLPGTWSTAIYGLLGNGDGTFSVLTYSFPVPAGCPAISVADFTSDNRPDVMLLCSGIFANPGLLFLTDTANGTFVVSDGFIAAAATADPQSDALALAAADFNSDGNQDVITRDKIFLGNGNGTLQTPTITGLSIRTAVATADFDLNGSLDVGYSVGFQVGIAGGDNMGGFGAPTSYPTGQAPHGMAVGDFNTDGKPDIVVANYSEHYVTVLLGKGDGTFPTSSNIDVVLNDTPTSVAVGDFNSDGKPDIVVADQVAVQVLINTSR